MPEIPQSWLEGEPDDIVTEMRGFAVDHEPDGWPAVRMRQITELCDEVERLRGALITGASLLERGCNASDMAAAMRRAVGAHNAK